MELQKELMVFTLFICLGAGVFAIQGFLAFLDKGEKLQLPALIVSLVSIGIGGAGSFLHLHHWERIFNGFGHLTSGITQELIMIVVFVIALTVFFFMMRRSEDNKAPKWCGIMAIVISIILVIIMSHSYNMSARPAWDTPMLWFYYLGNAVFFGALAMALIAGITKDDSSPLVARIALISGGIHALFTVVYTALLTMTANAFTDVGFYFDPTHPTKEMVNPQASFSHIFTGEHALLFWLGVVVIGLGVALVFTFLSLKKKGSTLAIYSSIALICALIGGMCFRAILYLLGFSVFMFY